MAAGSRTTIAHRPSFRCAECGRTTAKRLGRCPERQGWGTLEESGGAPPMRTTTPARPVAQVHGRSATALSTDVPGLDRVLGGGPVPGAASDTPPQKNLVAIGEVGLAGEVRRVTGTQRRPAEAARPDFTRALASLTPARPRRGRTAHPGAARRRRGREGPSARAQRSGLTPSKTCWGAGPAPAAEYATHPPVGCLPAGFRPESHWAT